MAVSGCVRSPGPLPTLPPVANTTQPPPAVTSPPSPTPTPTPTPVTVASATGRYLFMGDIFFGRYINDWSMASPLKYAYPFQRLDEYQPENYNAWVANFECPTVAGLHMTSAQMEATLTFNCDPEYLPDLAKWFPIVSLGNNHTDNQGSKGWTETKQNLKDAGIGYFGSPDPSEGPNCDVVLLPVSAAMSDGTTKELPLPVGMCGYNGVFKIPTAGELSEITEFAALMPVIAWPHSGAEYKAGPDQIKTQLYRDMIDAGADMVIGNHAHWVQSTEAYQGKLIVYSLGNFIFDQQNNPERTRSAVVDLTARVDDVSSLEAWAAIASQCEHNLALCKELVGKQGLTRVDLTYTYDVLGSNDADKLVRPATAGELAAIKERMNWDATMGALGQG